MLIITLAGFAGGERLWDEELIFGLLNTDLCANRYWYLLLIAAFLVMSGGGGGEEKK